MLKKAITVLIIIKFTAIVTLNKTDWENEVDSNVALEVKKDSMNVRFIT